MRINVFKGVKSIVSTITASLFVMLLIVLIFVSCADRVSLQPDYMVSIPATMDLGTVSEGDFAPKPKQTALYAVLEEDLQPVVEASFDITVFNANPGENQFIEVKTDKYIDVTEETTGKSAPVTVYPYERAFTGTGTKTGSVTLYKRDAGSGSFQAMTVFNIDLVTYVNEPKIIMALYNNALKNDAYAQKAFGTTTESKIAALKLLGYEAAYGFFSLSDWDILKKYGMSSAGARLLSDMDGEAYSPGYSGLDQGAKYVLSARCYKEKGYEFGNFDHQYYFAGMFSSISDYNSYASTWKSKVASAVELNKQLTAASEKYNYPIDFYLTQENEPMGNVGQSALEVAMFTEAIEKASAEAGVKNYCKATVDLVHTYSFLSLDLLNKDVSADWCVRYLKETPWAADYFQEKLGSPEIRKPNSIYEYMSLLDGNVCAIQFSDNNGARRSPFIGGMPGGMGRGASGGTQTGQQVGMPIGVPGKGPDGGPGVQQGGMPDGTPGGAPAGQQVGMPGGAPDEGPGVPQGMFGAAASDEQNELGSATGSHHVLGDGLIDFMEYMDALFNYAHLGETAQLGGGAYLVYEPWYNNIDDEKETIAAQQRLVEGIGEGPSWMKEWNLLYNVKRIETDDTSYSTPEADVQRQQEHEAANQIAIPGIKKIVFKAGQSETGIILQNPDGNPCNFIISLLSEDGTMLYQSGTIKPGKGTSGIVLDKALAAGNYNATIKYETTSLKDGSPMNGANVKVRLIVE